MSTISHTITCLGPMSHGDIGADTGNVMRFRRIAHLSPAGVPVYIPAISAGALRGVVRRILWRDIFDRTGLSRETLPGQWDRLYAALANGGTIEAAEKRVSPDEIRARRAALPVLSLLGAALYTSHMAGRARVSNSVLDCRESAAAGLPVDGAAPMRDLLADETRVRHVDREEQDTESSGVGPMPTTVETVISGARFVGHTHCAPSLEASAWAYGLDRVTHLGGKSAAGFGEVRVQHDGDASEYAAWLDANVETLRASLLALADALAKGGKGKKGKPKSKKAAPTPPPAKGDDSLALF